MALPRRRPQKGDKSSSNNAKGWPWQDNQDTHANSGGFFVNEGLDSGLSSGEDPDDQPAPAPVQNASSGPAEPITSAVEGLSLPHPHLRRRQRSVDPDEDQEEWPDDDDGVNQSEDRSEDSGESSGDDGSDDSDGQEEGSDDSDSGKESDDGKSSKKKDDDESSKKEDESESEDGKSEKKGDPNASSTDNISKNKKKDQDKEGSGNGNDGSDKSGNDDSKDGKKGKKDQSSSEDKKSGSNDAGPAKEPSGGKGGKGGFVSGLKAGIASDPNVSRASAALAAKREAANKKKENNEGKDGKKPSKESGSGKKEPSSKESGKKSSDGSKATGRKAEGRASGGTGLTSKSASAGKRGGIGGAIAGAGTRLGNFAGRKLGNMLGGLLGHGINLGVKALSTAFRAGRAMKRGIGHLLAFIKLVATPPGLWVTILANVIVWGILFGITGLQTFGPSDIDCTKVQQQTKEILNNGNSGAAAHTVAAWVDAYGQAAFDAGKKYGIPYEAILAQSAWESGWNTSTLSKQYHNFFGIKAYKGWSGKTVNMATGEEVNGGNITVQSDFIAPSSDAEGFEAYGQFIRGNSRYNQALQYPNDYHKYIEELKKAGYATDSSYVSNITGLADQFAKYIAENHKFPPSTDVVPDMPKPGAGDTSTPKGSTTDGTGKDPSVAVACTEETKNSEGVYGSAGEMKECDAENCDFSWMCSIGICKSGDPGSKGIYPHLEYGYQCVWYAWQRLSMIHGTKGWMWLVGNGGDIWAAAAGNPQWEADLTPHPGDGISGHNAPFAGSTHVAVVEKVAPDPSGWKVYISEGNANGTASWNSYGTRWLTKSQLGVGNSGNDIHFFRNKSWAPISTNS